jgi:hypothetical protein
MDVLEECWRSVGGVLEGGVWGAKKMPLERLGKRGFLCYFCALFTTCYCLFTAYLLLSLSGGACWNRTNNPLIKSQLLCQLS